VITIHVPTRARQAAAAAAGRLRGLSIQSSKPRSRREGGLVRGCGSSADGGSERDTDQNSPQQQQRRSRQADQRQRQQQQRAVGGNSEDEGDVYAGVMGDASEEGSDLDIPEVMLPPHLLRNGGMDWPPARREEGQQAASTANGAAAGGGGSASAADGSMSSLLLRLQQATSKAPAAAAAAPAAGAAGTYSSPLAAHRAGLPQLGVPGVPSREASAGLASPGGCVGALGPLGSPWSSGVLLGGEGSVGESIIAHIGQEGSYGRRW
jgi:hypothetical protein